MARDPEPEVSVCIVTWNVAADLRACLQSLRVQQGSPSTEVIVVDNASADNTVQMLRDEFPEVTALRNTENLGFAAATNQALARARGRYLMMLNPDTVLPADALSRMVQVADDNPRAGIVAPRLVYPDGSLQYSCRRFPTITAAIFRNTILGALFPGARAAADYVMADWDHASAREVDWASGAAIAIRRELYQRIGPLDEGFRWGSEDVDYCLRAHQAGWGVLYTPEPVIVHTVGRSSDQAVVRSIITAHHSMYRLYAKHFARNPISRLLVWIGIWMRASLLITTWWARRALSQISAWVRRPFVRRPEGKP